MTVTVSVVIPTHNRHALLERTIKSVLNQTYQDFEVIVVDDFGASANCICLDARIRYYRVQSDGYIAYSRNVGIERSTGVYIAFLDDDDIWLPDKLEKQVVMMMGGVAMCCGNMYVISKVGEYPKKQHFPDKHSMAGNLLNEMILQPFACTPTVIVRKDILKKLHGFLVRPKLKVGEDLDLFMRIAATGNISYDSTPHVVRLWDLKTGDNYCRAVTTSTRTSRYQFTAIRFVYQHLLGYPIPVLSRLLAWFEIVNYTTKILHDALKGE